MSKKYSLTVDLTTKIPFGKYKGTPLHKIRDINYLRWLNRNTDFKIPDEVFSYIYRRISVESEWDFNSPKNNNTTSNTSSKTERDPSLRGIEGCEMFIWLGVFNN